MKTFTTKGMISLMIDKLISLLYKDDLFENFFTIDKISFALVSISNIELQLEFVCVSKKDPLCKVIRFAKFEPMLVKNVLNFSVISSSLYCLLLSINTYGNLLMCDCFSQIICLSTFHVSTLLFLRLLIKSEKVLLSAFFYINVDLFL